LVIPFIPGSFPEAFMASAAAWKDIRYVDVVDKYINKNKNLHNSRGYSLSLTFIYFYLVSGK
jgi:hypothetical protein